MTGPIPTAELPEMPTMELYDNRVSAPAREPHHVLRSWDERCDLQATQELPVVHVARPAREWPQDALERLLRDVQAVRP